MVETHNNLGNALRDLGKVDEAIASYERALARDPGYAGAHWNRSLVWLLQGKFEQGWPEYEWRLRTPQLAISRHAFSQPFWDGSALAGRTILLYAEQGLGDTLQFIRYARLVKERGGTVIVECPASLLALVASCPGLEVEVLPTNWAYFQRRSATWISHGLGG